MGSRRGWRRVMSYAVALGAATVLAGCSGDEPEVDVLGSWILVSGSTADGPLDVPDGSRVSLTFADGSAGGKAPCNDYGSPYEMDGDELDFTEGGIAQTLVGCEGADGELEAAYLSALGEARTAMREADTLTLSGDDVELEFRLTPPWSRSEVVGRTWWLASWTDDTGAEHEATWEPGSRPFLRLDTKGDRGGPVTARSGCRTMRGHWTDWRDQPTITRSGWRGDCLHFTDQARAVESVMSEMVVEVRQRDGQAELVVRNAHGSGRTQLVYRR
ncbi:heat shock protein HslJ [Nocardioides sp. BE266]|uniref:META domain-containing protein n=1 Tax=Nocardioides sp. BE266 TaxID=2817725 RepID=UPI002863D12C|nr:META domain-containing protein [Nocardioides sp. BE266]MDR7253995.1 heat shock protein HslJ [Nocardioides sp. BE266]